MDPEQKFINAARKQHLCSLVDEFGNHRKVEPYGVFYQHDKSDRQFCCYQLKGYSKSGSLPNWRNPYVANIKDVIILEEVFAIRESFSPGNQKLYPHWIFHIKPL